MSGQPIVSTLAISVEEQPSDRVAALFDAHHQRLYRLARRSTSSADDALDLLQETFLRVARAPKRVPLDASREEAWLVRVLINVCRDNWRHAAVHVRAVADGNVASPGAINPEPGLVAHATVWRALDLLPARRRTILVLSELEGTPIGEIARLLGVTPVTIRWHLMRARREMARALGDER